jgi:hypothetical protein
MCAAMPPTFIEVTRNKEIQALLKFGRESNWPLQVTFASVVSENVSAPITYQVDWEGCDGSNIGLGTSFRLPQKLTVSLRFPL